MRVPVSDVVGVTSAVLAGCPDVSVFAVHVAISSEGSMRDRYGSFFRYVEVHLSGPEFADASRVAGVLGLALVECRFEDIEGHAQAWLTWAGWVDLPTSMGLPVCVEVSAIIDRDDVGLVELAGAVA